MENTSPLTVARFWSKVDVRYPEDCWNWNATVNEAGYGIFQQKKAHRVAYEYFFGPIATELVARHKCDNPSCCNPYHIEPGTHTDNANDALTRGRFCYGERHPNAKLSDEQVAMVRASTLKGAALAKQLGVSKSTISGIRTFRHRRRTA